MKDNDTNHNHMLRELVVDIFDSIFSKIDFKHNFWSLNTERIWQEPSTYGHKVLLEVVLTLKSSWGNSGAHKDSKVSESFSFW